MNKIELQLTSKFAVGEEVFMLSTNGRRIERGKITRIELGQITLSDGVNQSPVMISHWNNSYIVANLSRSGDWNRLRADQIFTSYDAAVAARKTSTDVKFGRNRMSIASSVKKFLENVNRNDLEEKDRKFYDRMKKLCQEEGF